MPCIVISPAASPTTESAHTVVGSRDRAMCSHSGCSHSGPSCQALGTRHSSGHPTLPALSVMSSSSLQALPPGASPLGTSWETGKSEHYCSLCCVPILNPCLGVLSRCPPLSQESPCAAASLTGLPCGQAIASLLIWGGSAEQYSLAPSIACWPLAASHIG